jgi:hypothetical protein
MNKEQKELIEKKKSHKTSAGTETLKNNWFFLS